MRHPPPEVRLVIQDGPTATRRFVAPTAHSAARALFELVVPVRETPQGSLLTGTLIQGPAGSKFIYVNIGRQAGDASSPFDRRVKVSLAGVSVALLQRAMERDAALEVEYSGIGPDGTPACATVPLDPDWHVVDESG